MLVIYETAHTEDFLREMAAAARDPLRQWVLTVGILTTLAGAAAVAGGTAWAAIGGLLALGVSLFHFALAALMVRHAVRQRPAWLNGNFRYRLDDDGIAWETELVAIRYGWAALTSVRTARHGMHFYAGRRVVMGLPLRGMTTEQLVQVRATLSERDLLRPRPLATAASTRSASAAVVWGRAFNALPSWVRFVFRRW